jgi:hypothetical protein
MTVMTGARSTHVCGIVRLLGKDFFFLGDDRANLEVVLRGDLADHVDFEHMILGGEDVLVHQLEDDFADAEAHGVGEPLHGDGVFNFDYAALDILLNFHAVFALHFFLLTAETAHQGTAGGVFAHHRGSVAAHGIFQGACACLFGFFLFLLGGL